MKDIYTPTLRHKNLLTIFLLVCINLQLTAQTVTNYTFAASSGTFTALTSPTNPSLSGGTVDDGYFNTIPIGFDFWYMGARYTTVSASTNGWLTLGASIIDAAYANSLTSGTALRPTIAPLWDDLDVQVATNVSYKLTGSAPNRVFAIQYLNAQWQYNATGNTISFQVKLYEGTGKVEFVYRPETGTLATPTASIGITATATGSGNFLSVNNAGTSASSTTEASVTSKPASGKTYAFTPPVPTAPGSLTFSSVGTSSMTLNWSDLSSNESGFVIYKSTDAVTYSFASQTVAGATSSAQSGLTEGTTYYWKVYAVSEGGLSLALSGSQATTVLALSNWMYRKAITIDYTKVGTGPHTNFPVLISMIDANLQAKAQTDADDIIFIASDGTTRLAHEIESYTSASGTLVAWVNIPSLSSSANTVIYMYYGNASATSLQDVTGTWDASFKGVYHLNSAFADATSNANNGTNTGTIASTGKISGGSGFVRSDGSDYITINGLMGSPTSFTLSSWATLTTADPNAAEIISIGDYSVLRYDEAGANKTSGVAYNGASTWTTTASGINYAGTGWHYVVYTFDNLAHSQKVYVDGAQVATSSSAAAPVYTGGGANTFIGKHGNANINMDFDGTIDEARVASASRSAGWVLTEYNNQNSPSTFYSVGGEVATKTFTGTGNFSDAARWTGGIVPVAGDNLIIDGDCTVDNNVGTDNIVYGTLIIGTATARTLNWATSGTNRLNVTNISAGAGASLLDMTNGGTLIIRGTWTSTNLAFSPGTGTIDTRSTMTLPAAYATYNNLTINGSLTTVTAGVGTSVTNFSMLSGSVDLNTLTLTVTGTANYTSGTINNGTVTSTGATTTFAGTSFGAMVNASSDNLVLNGSIFNSAVLLTKNGTTTITSNGGNTFNSTVTISNSSSANFTLANVSPDIFNGNAVFTNTGTAALNIANNSAGNLFSGTVTINNIGTGSTIRSSFGSLATATYGGNIVVNNTSTVGIYFGATGGTTTLAATKTISKGGTGFTTGTLLLREFTQLGSTAQALTLTGSTALLQMGPSVIFNGSVNFISPQLVLNGCTFNSTASLTKNGGFDNVSTGGNIFNGATTLVCSGIASLDLGNTSPETFNSDLTINNTGGSRIQIGISSVGNLFNGNVTINHGGNTGGLNTVIARNTGSTATFNGNLVLNCTNSNTGSGIIIANDGHITINGNITVSSTNGRGILFGAATGTVTLANGFTMSAGSFTTGTLTLSGFTQTGSTAQNITLTGTANLLAGPSSVFNGQVIFSAPQFMLNNCQYNNTALLTKTGAIDNTWTAVNVFNGATTIANSGTGFLRLSNIVADDFNSDASFIQTGSGLLQPAYGSNCTIAGNLSTAGTATAITFGAGSGTVTLNGTGAQSISGSIPPIFTNLVIAGTGNIVTSGVNSNVTGTLSVTSGIFDLGSFTVNRSTTGGTLTVSNGATLKIGGTNTIPSNYSTHSVGPTSTIEYSGTNQAVAVLNSSQDYGNLNVSGGGLKSLSGNIIVSAALKLATTNDKLSIGTNTFTLTGTVNGSSAGYITGSSSSNISIGGSGPFGTLLFDPATPDVTNMVNNLTINRASSGTVTLGNALRLSNVLTPTAGVLASAGYLTLASPHPIRHVLHRVLQVVAILQVML